MNVHKLVIAAGLALTSDDQPICCMFFAELIKFNISLEFVHQLKVQS